MAFKVQSSTDITQIGQVHYTHLADSVPDFGRTTLI
jgi:hypothetical protein